MTSRYSNLAINQSQPKIQISRGSANNHHKMHGLSKRHQVCGQLSSQKLSKNNISSTVPPRMSMPTLNIRNPPTSEFKRSMIRHEVHRTTRSWEQMTITTFWVNQPLSVTSLATRSATVILRPLTQSCLNIHNTTWAQSKILNPTLWLITQSAHSSKLIATRGKTVWLNLRASSI